MSSSQPHARPVIGITPDNGLTIARPGRPVQMRFELKRSYSDAVARAGGAPVILPYLDDDAAIEAQLSSCDALVVSGGGFDVPPDFYGAAPHPQLGPLHRERSTFERKLLEKALARNLPILGVCGGHQLLAVVLGATLFQDLPSEQPSATAHEQAHDPREEAHTVTIAADSLLGQATRASSLGVNSTHHQGVRTPGRARVAATAPDGLIEAIELPTSEARFVLGVQWHPELMRDERNLAIYEALVAAAVARPSR